MVSFYSTLSSYWVLTTEEQSYEHKGLLVGLHGHLSEGCYLLETFLLVKIPHRRFQGSRKKSDSEGWRSGSTSRVPA
jgi:hypothetical protein